MFHRFELMRIHIVDDHSNTIFLHVKCRLFSSAYAFWFLCHVHFSARRSFHFKSGCRSRHSENILHCNNYKICATTIAATAAVAMSKFDIFSQYIFVWFSAQAKHIYVQKHPNTNNKKVSKPNLDYFFGNIFQCNMDNLKLFSSDQSFSVDGFLTLYVYNSV